MKFSKKSRFQEQYPNRGVWDVLHPSYLTIGGSGIVGNFGPESPMSERQEESREGASMNSGDGAAAGAATTYGGSGVA